MMRRSILAALLLGALAGRAQAEVRLGHDRKSVTVRVTVSRDGAWTPRGRVDGATLNPAGDLRGDHAPTIAVADGAALAAWHSPAGGSLMLALGHARWEALASLPDARVSVSPQSATLDDGWFVAWTRESTGEACVSRVRLDGTLSATVAVATGEVQAIAVAGSTVTVIVQDEHGQLIALSGGIVPTVPPVIWRTSPLSDGIVQLSRGNAASPTEVASVLLPDGVPVIFRRGDSTTLLQGPWRGTGASEARSVALAGSMVAAVQLSTDKSVALWWRDARTLEFVEISGEGVGEVRQVTGHADFSPSLVREALRSVGAE